MSLLKSQSFLSARMLKKNWEDSLDVSAFFQDYNTLLLLCDSLLESLGLFHFMALIKVNIYQFIF